MYEAQMHLRFAVNLLHHNLNFRSNLKKSEMHTYHCLCSNLLLATTHELSSLQRRAGESLDHAYILPCPAVPRKVQSAEVVSDHNSVQYTQVLSLNTTPRQPAIVVRRSDGFEKRYILRCGRCKLIAGYQLDWSQYAAAGEDNELKSGRREDILYLLPGAVTTTEDMMHGKKPSAQEINLGQTVQA